jgi:ubiquitin-conjugating enzyme E2 D/E
MAMIQRRLLKEFKVAEENSAQITKLQPKGNDMLQLEAKIVGPDNSPYADHIFTLDIHMPTDFPFKPPKVKFNTRVYHPSIKDDGSICLEVLGEKWTPNLSLVTILLQIIELLADPSTENPVVPAIAQQILKNPQEFYDTARMYTKKYAQPKESQ